MTEQELREIIAIDENYLNPLKENQFVQATYPDNPRHPRQKYYLTELGLGVLILLSEDKR